MSQRPVPDSPGHTGTTGLTRNESGGTRLPRKHRLLLALSLVLALAFLGLSVINYLFTRASVRQEILSKDLPLTRDNIYSEISAELMGPLMVASSMANDTFLKDWALDGEQDATKITDYLLQIRDKYDYFSTFFVSQTTGRYYHFKGLHKVIRPDDEHDVWFYRFTRLGKEYQLDVDTDQAANNILTIFINFRVTGRDGKLLGVTGLGLKMDRVATLIRTYQAKYDRSIYLVDRQGLIQVHQDNAAIERQMTETMPEMSELMPRILTPDKEPANYQVMREGHPILLTVRYIPQLDWFLFVEQDETTSLAEARTTFMRTLLIGLVTSLLIIGLTIAAINRYQRRLEDLAESDALTGAANRRGLEQAFTRALYARERYGREFSLILMDLDGFKRVNDDLGHLAGDQVLSRFAGLVASTIRPSDVLARWGGDEFLVVAESNLSEALLLAERIRRLVRDADMASADAKPDDPRENLTVTCGVTQYRKGDSLDAMARRADVALYAGKAKGGDRVEQEPESRSDATA